MHDYAAEGGTEATAAETILSPLDGREKRRRIDAYDLMGERELAVEAAGTAEETRTTYAYDGSGLSTAAYGAGALGPTPAATPPRMAFGNWNETSLSLVRVFWKGWLQSEFCSATHMPV